MKKINKDYPYSTFRAYFRSALETQRDLKGFKGLFQTDVQTCNQQVSFLPLKIELYL